MIIHLLVSFVPYLNSKELNGFWNYNKILFLRLCASVLYSVFIYIGLVLALLAVDNLFHLDVDSKLYFELYIVIIGLFNTWFFISGIPKSLDDLEQNQEYPKGLKIFTQYVLLPLLILYLLILYSYATKIIINWDWPKGWVSYLVSGVSILGFFNVLLIYPYGKLKENEWINKFTKLFYYSLIPLTILLFIAIFFRVNDYGITIKRYSVILLGVWIFLVCFYFIFKKDNIKFIPITLAILLLLSSFGPWGMFSVSEKSQIERLKIILEDNNILMNGKVTNEVIWIKDSLPDFESNLKLTNNKILIDSLHNEVKSILDYLDDFHGMKKIGPWFTQDLDSMVTFSDNNSKYRYYNEARVYMESLGMNYKKRYSSKNTYQNYNYSSKNVNLINVKGYDYVYPFNLSSYQKFTKELKTKKSSISFSRNNNTLHLYRESDSISIDLKKTHQKLFASYGKTTIDNISPQSLTSLYHLKGLDIKIQFNRINFSYEKDTLNIGSVEGCLLFNEK